MQVQEEIETSLKLTPEEIEALRDIILEKKFGSLPKAALDFKNRIKNDEAPHSRKQLHPHWQQL